MFWIGIGLIVLGVILVYYSSVRLAGTFGSKKPVRVHPTSTRIWSNVQSFAILGAAVGVAFVAIDLLVL